MLVMTHVQLNGICVFSGNEQSCVACVSQIHITSAVPNRPIIANREQSQIATKSQALLVIFDGQALLKQHGLGWRRRFSPPIPPT